MKVHQRLKRSEVECCRLLPCKAGAEPTVHKAGRGSVNLFDPRASTASTVASSKQQDEETHYEVEYETESVPIVTGDDVEARSQGFFAQRQPLKIDSNYPASSSRGGGSLAQSISSSIWRGGETSLGVVAIYSCMPPDQCTRFSIGNLEWHVEGFRVTPNHGGPVRE